MNEPTPTEDRRDSRRVPIRFMVREGNLGSFEERSGNLSLGGISYSCNHPPSGSSLELRFFLPGSRDEVRVTGEILRVVQQGMEFGIHAKFSELPLEAELAIARYIEQP